MASLAFARSSFIVLATFLLLSCFPDRLISEALDLEQKLSGAVVTDMEVNLPADELWAVYSSPNYLKLLASLSPDVYDTVTYLEGDGGEGTIVNVTYIASPDEFWYGEIIEIDNKTKTRTLTELDGTFRKAGFTNFAAQIQVTETGINSCIIRFSFLFEIDQQSMSNVTLMGKSWLAAEIAADYVNSQRSTPIVLQKQYSGEIVSDLTVNLPANELWREYRRKDFGHLLLRLLPDYYKDVIYENGHGEVGTLFNITLQPAFGSTQWVEEFCHYSERKMTRENQYVEGRYLISGFTEYKTAVTVIPKTRRSTVIRALETYKINPESLSNASTLNPWWDPAIAISNYAYSKEYLETVTDYGAMEL